MLKQKHWRNCTVMSKILGINSNTHTHTHTHPPTQTHTPTHTHPPTNFRYPDWIKDDVKLDAFHKDLEGQISESMDWYNMRNAIVYWSQQKQFEPLRVTCVWLCLCVCVCLGVYVCVSCAYCMCVMSPTFCVHKTLQPTHTHIHAHTHTHF